jgi:type IV pilus assembly protein PilB
MKLGDMLVKAGKVTPEDIEKALKIQEKDGGKIGQILVRMGAISDENIISEFVGKQLNIGALRLSDIELNPEIVQLIPEDIARKFNVIAISKLGKTLIVAISDPNNIYVLDAIKFITGCTIQPVISPENAISRSIDTYYGAGSAEMDAVLSELEDELEIVDVGDNDADMASLESAIAEKPLVKLVSGIILDAIKRGASDIHFEQYEKRIRVRYRVDGDLMEMAPLPYKYRHAITSRLKIMSELNIAERRLPQDGRIKIKFGERTVDMRVSVLPTIFGEKVVMRILDPKGLRTDLTKLGFPAPALESFNKAIRLPYGMVLVTGPTGSGKTTTLYSAVTTLNDVHVNIMTAEDPVEYNFDGINQVAVRSEIGLTFAAALRSFLRQDPDIIMVGEIRDTETAEIAIQAALTGHLVFSTLHTNDAPSTIARLVDMDIPSYLVAPSVKLIMAQRLARRICLNCRTPYTPKPEMIETLGLDPVEAANLTLYQPKGCSECGGTGYSGRVGMFEVLVVTDRIERLILDNASTDELRKAAVDEGMLTLRMSGIEKLKEGTTSVEQVLANTVE